ncbi:MAG: hypothetical protein R3B47_09915 [Bacteroidia bacterium]
MAKASHFLLLGFTLMVACGDPGVISRWENGKPHEIKRFSGDSGTENYVYQEFDKNGVKIMEGPIIDGKRHGKWQGWHSNGRLKFSKGYYLGNAWGYEFEFAENGRHLTEINRNEAGQYDGKFLTSHPDGTLASEGWFKNGNMIGEWRFYSNDNSLPRAVEHYSGDGKIMWSKERDTLGDGKMIYTAWYSDGSIRTTGSYKNAERDGYFRFFPKSEEIVNVEEENNECSFCEGLYIRDKRAGLWTFFAPDSSTQRQVFYKDSTELLVFQMGYDEPFVRNGKGVVWAFVDDPSDSSFQFSEKHYFRDCVLVKKRRIERVVRY